MAPKIDLYYMVESPPSRIVRLTAAALELDLNLIEFDIMGNEYLQPEFTKINPQHVCPTIVDGDFVLWESRVICSYLATKYGDGSLYSNDPKERAMIDRLLHFDLGTLYQRYGDYAFGIGFEGETQLYPKRLEKLKDSLKVLNTMLEGKKYAIGDRITIADHAIVASLSSMYETGIDLTPFSNVMQYLKRCESTMPRYEEVNGVGAKRCGQLLRSTFPKE